MKNTVFTGAATALITPMNEQGIDYESFGRLIDFQIESGIDALVVTGTTGENATLTDEEHVSVMEYCVKRTNHRVPVIASTGSNYTDHAIWMTKEAARIGADAVLLVTPYYNKATQEGLLQSYTALADASELPCILYNVPSRTGCNLLPETLAVLCKHPKIVGVKEASGDISQVAKIAQLCGDDLTIYSGNDDQIVPILSLGGQGVISVLSNLVPGETSKMCHAYLEGDRETALTLQLRYLPLIQALFSEVNPIPAKAAMAAMGYGENYMRLPLTPMNKEKEARMLSIMQELGILV